MFLLVGRVSQTFGVHHRPISKGIYGGSNSVTCMNMYVNETSCGSVCRAICLRCAKAETAYEHVWEEREASLKTSKCYTCLV